LRGRFTGFTASLPRRPAARIAFVAQHETFGLAQLDRFCRLNSGKPRKAQPEAA